jgi:hypothetical protein
VFGVEIKPSEISTIVYSDAVDVLRQSEIDVAFSQISDEDAQEHENMCKV